MICRTCQEDKDTSCFYPTQNTKSGFEVRCKACKAARKRELYAEDPSRREKAKERAKQRYQLKSEEIYAYVRSWVKENPERRLVYTARHRAKSSGKDCTITEKDISIPETCPLLGIPLKESTGQVSPNSPTIDRLDPLLGYIPGNVWVISHKANQAKSNLTLSELELLVKNLREKLNG